MNWIMEMKKCKPGEYYCYTDKKCKKIPMGWHIARGGYIEKDNDENETKKNGNGNGGSNGNGGNGNGGNGNGNGDGGGAVSEAAVSKKQQRFFGMVRATQKGEMENPSPEVAKVAATAKRSDVKKFAKTKHKKLPEKVTAKEESNPSTLVKKVMQKDSEKKRKNALLIQKVIGASRKLKGNFIDEGHYGKEVNKIPKELDKAVALHKSQAERLRASDEFKKDAGKIANKIPDQLDKSVAMHKKQAKQLRDAGVGEKNCGCGQTPCKTYSQKSVKESFEIDPKSHRQQQRASKIRNLAKKGATEGERSAAERKTKGPKMFGETAYYRQDASYQKKLSDQSKVNKEKDARMKYGKNWKKFTSDVDAAKNRLRKGEVKKFNKQTGKWESNKD